MRFPAFSALYNEKAGGALSVEAVPWLEKQEKDVQYGYFEK
ncbi:MAG: hypothetical protein N3A63_02750 [Bacteroidetes bacterium]|nr:hypothetical protein [Bacteroidota bacterium]